MNDILIKLGQIGIVPVVALDDAADAFKALAENDGSLAKVLIEF